MDTAGRKVKGRLVADPVQTDGQTYVSIRVVSENGIEAPVPLDFVLDVQATARANKDKMARVAQVSQKDA